MTNKYYLTRWIRALKTIEIPDPPVMAVYFLLLKGVVVYVGSTENLEQRVMSHFMSMRGACQDSYKEFDEVRYIEMTDIEQAQIAEARFMLELVPSQNKQVATSKGRKTLQRIGKTR